MTRGESLMTSLAVSRLVSHFVLLLDMGPQGACVNGCGAKVCRSPKQNSLENIASNPRTVTLVQFESKKVNRGVNEL